MFHFSEFELFLASDFTDLYDWFEVRSIQGLTKAESVSLNDSKVRIHSFVSYSPKDVLRQCEYKPYMYLNHDMINELTIQESAFIIMGACVKLSRILASGEDDDEIFEFAESLALAIADELHFPNVYMKI